MKNLRFFGSVVAPVLIATLIIFVGCPDDSGDTTTFKYTCDNGIAKTGAPSGTSNVVACASCNDGFKLMGTAGVNGTTCVAPQYTCENGTPVDGTPSGTSNVERCQSCASGYTLSGSAGADGTTCVVEKDTTKPTFTAGPALKAGSTGATSVTVTLTASEVGKVFWVAYAATAAAPADAAALIDDATRDTAPSTVVARSATAGVDVSTDAVEIAITGLEKGTPYDFYAVLQDSAGNNSALSPTLEITTASTAIYTCENGTARTGLPNGSSDIVACQSCHDGFKLTGAPGADTTACLATQYTCPANGTAKSGSTTTNADHVVCASCNPGFKLAAPSGGTIGENGTTCVPDTDTTKPTFTTAPALNGSPTANGAVVTLTASEAGKLFWVLYTENTPAPATAEALIAAASESSSAGVQRSGDSVAVDAATEKTVTLSGLTAGTSYNFYAVLQDTAGNTSALSAKLAILTAAVGSYTCTNGTPVDGTPSGGSDVEECTSCNPGYTINASKQCRDITAPTFSAGPTLDASTDTTVTLKLTPSEAGTLFWAVYADGSSVADDAALIKDATADPKPATVIIRSAPAGVGVTTTEETVTLTGLTAGTPYDFYAVLQDSAGNTSALSQIDIATVVTATYTCDNGTAKAGGPSGSADVEECTACNPGYTLNASKQCRDTTDPIFSAAPALKPGSITDTGAEITLTASEAGKLFWVLYADGAITTAPSAAALIAAASGNTVGVQQSGDSVTVDAATEFMVTLTSLTPITSYDFYAVLQDAAQNTSAVSNIDITTLTGYTCTDGMPKAGSPGGTTNVGACQSCNSGFKLMGSAGVNGTTCVATQYTCSNGTVQTGTPTTGNADIESCTACNNSYKLGGTGGDDCVPAVYTCANGTAKTTTADDKPTGTADIEYCTACDDTNTHTLITNFCAPNNQFTRHPNGVTIVCPGVADGATGVIDSVTYTKRDASSDITVANAATTCTSGITDMSELFRVTVSNDPNDTFNGDISHWDTSSVTDMSSMFNGAQEFNQDIGSWDVGNVENMRFMFSGLLIAIGARIVHMGFAQDIGNWDVSKVTNMSNMFQFGPHFNSNIGDWEVSKVTNMSNMFNDADAFNQDIGDWDVSMVTNMGFMFSAAGAFNQDLSGWCVKDLSAPTGFATRTPADFNTARQPQWGTTVASCPASQ